MFVKYTQYFVTTDMRKESEKACVCVYISPHNIYGLPQWLSGKESACNAGDTGDAGSIPGSGRYPGGGNGNPFQYSCLENPMDSETSEVQSRGSQRHSLWFYGLQPRRCLCPWGFSRQEYWSGLPCSPHIYHKYMVFPLLKTVSLR